MPIHVCGFTFFPSARCEDGAWLPVVHVVVGKGTVSPYRCAGTHDSEAAAVQQARLEALDLAADLKSRF